MRLPQHQFLLPILDGDISEAVHANGQYFRKATNFSLRTPVKGEKANFIISLRSETNIDIFLETNDETKVVSVYSDYTFLYVNFTEKVSLRSAGGMLYAQLIICYIPPLTVSGVELMEKLLGLGRFRMLTPKPHEGNLINKNFYNISDPANQILPIGLRVNESLSSIAKYLKASTIISSEPQIIEIESTGFCNLKCVHCPQGVDGGMPYPPKPISSKVIDNLSGFMRNAKSLMLHGYGEPLASPQTWKILDNIRDAETSCHFNTNGLLLNEKNINLIIERKNLKGVNISIDSCTNETFYKIRGADLNIVIKNVKSLLKAKLDCKREDLQVSITMVLMRENLDELTGFIELASELNVPAVIWNLKFNNSFYSSTGFQAIDEWSVIRDGWRFSYDEQLPHLDTRYSDLVANALEVAKNLNVSVYGLSSWPNELTASDPRYYNGLESMPSDCPYYKDSLYISSNGDVRMCCYQIGSKPIDNITNKSADLVWNGVKISKIRAELASDKVPAICSSATCQYVRGS